MLDYNWTYRASEDQVSQMQLCDKMGNLPSALARALSNRGIKTQEEARQFFSPSVKDLWDPFLMKDMDLAAARVQKAIETGERILVYGDYDVDGTSATALLVLFLRKLGADVLYFIPHRYRDGCGLKKIGIDYAINSHSKLLITVDCGVTAVEEVAYASENNLDVIVCDHHNPGPSLPKALAVLDPKRSDCPYPFKELSGCGVGFKLAQGVLKQMNLDSGLAYEYMDLVALSIASDIVSVSGENRIILQQGLERIREKPRTSLRVLAAEVNLDLTKCSVSQIIFSIGPRINAAGRMGDARTAVELLICKENCGAKEIAKSLEHSNMQRREMDRQTFEEAIGLIENGPPLDSLSSIVLFKPDWHLGVIGIVASRLVDRYHKPVIMISTVDGEAKGSARSISGFNIYEPIEACSDMLIRFGGHAYAAGVSLDISRVDEFKVRLDAEVKKRLDGQVLEREIKVDTPLGLSEITPQFWSFLDQFGPFGPGNRKIVFLGNRFRVQGYPSVVGSGHLRFRVLDTQQCERRKAFEVIGYNMSEKLPIVRTSADHGTPISLVFTIEENFRNGQRELQLCLKDVKLSCDMKMGDGEEVWSEG